MINLPKTLTVLLFVFTFLFSIVNLFLSFNFLYEIEIFRYLNKFFLLILLSGIFFSLYHRNGNKRNLKIDYLMNNPITTLLILTFSIIILSFFIIGLIKFGFGIKKVLYWQISSFVLSFLAIGIFINNHLNLLKDKK